MSTGRGSTKVDAYPYRYGGENLEFDYESYELEGNTHSLGDTLELDLTDDEEGDWDTATLTVSLSVRDSTLQRVFPSSTPNEGALVVNAYCPTNHHRFETVVADAPLTPGEYTGQVELERCLLRGRIELTPVLLRTEQLDAQPPGHTGPPFAERPGMKLAHGPTGTVDVDEPRGGRSKDLPTIPTSFADAAFPADDGNMWYLDTTDESSPKLHINSDHGFLPSFYEDEGSHGRGRVRRLVVDLQGTQILTQFVLEAAEIYVVHGEMKYPWVERMLTEVCDDLFEDKSPDEVESMLEPGELSETINQVATQVQRRRTPHESLERVLSLSL